MKILSFEVNWRDSNVGINYAVITAQIEMDGGQIFHYHKAAMNDQNVIENIIDFLKRDALNEMEARIK